MVYIAWPALRGKSGLQEQFNDFWNGARSVRTGLTIIMMMFFASLALDLTIPAVILVGAMALDWASVQLKRGMMVEGRAA